MYMFCHTMMNSSQIERTTADEQVLTEVWPQKLTHEKELHVLPRPEGCGFWHTPQPPADPTANNGAWSVSEIN